MSRVDEKDVRTIIETEADISMSPFIESAASLVDYVNTCDTGGVLSDNQLRVLEMWLAAHFYETRDQGLHEASNLEASGTFQGKTDMHLNASKWGQQAIALDVSGCLGRLQQEATNGKKQLTLFWGGKTLT